MLRYFAAAFLLTATVAWSDDETPPPAAPSGPTPLIVQAVEDKYAAALEEIARTRRTAADARLKAYQDQLAAHTKAGDFDKAQATKARIAELEAELESLPQKRPRPKETVRFRGHTYALVKEPATWHVAKRRCEEMGGHLAIIDSAPEDAFLKGLCQNGADSAWIGATDELIEGEWRWVNGSPVTGLQFGSDNANDSEHYLAYWISLRQWQDVPGIRLHYVCEWAR